MSPRLFLLLERSWLKEVLLMDEMESLLRPGVLIDAFLAAGDPVGVPLKEVRRESVPVIDAFLAGDLASINPVIEPDLLDGEAEDALRASITLTEDFLVEETPLSDADLPLDGESDEDLPSSFTPTEALLAEEIVATPTTPLTDDDLSLDGDVDDGVLRPSTTLSEALLLAGDSPALTGPVTDADLLEAGETEVPL